MSYAKKQATPAFKNDKTYLLRIQDADAFGATLLRLVLYIII